MKYFLIFFTVVINLSLTTDNSEFTYYKFDTISYSESLGKGVYGADEIMAVNVCMQIDNTFNTYIISYTNSERKRGSVAFKTYKGKKLIHGMNNNLESIKCPFKIDFKVFLISNYFIIDNLSSYKAFSILESQCPFSDFNCDTETQGSIKGKYSFKNPVKINKSEYISNLKK